MQPYYPSTIREEELKNRVAADFFGRYDCTRIVGNIDFCVSAKARDTNQMTFMPEEPLFWAEAKNHPTDVHRMLAQLVLTIRGETTHLDTSPPRFIGCFDNEKIAFVEYHNILPVFSLNDFNWTQTPSAVDDKTVETLRGIIPAEKVTVFEFSADSDEIKNFIRRNLVSGMSADLSMQVDRNNFIFVYQKWRNKVMPHIDAPWDILKKKYSLYDRDFFLAELNTDDRGTVAVDDDRSAEDFYIEFNASSRLPYSIRRKNEDELDISLSFGFKADGLEAYASFWRRYKRPPKKECWDYIVSRLDLLVPQDVRERKGSFFTPAIWVEKSQQYLAAELGENWQDDHYVWDCCAGTGNLLAGLTNKYRVWASTLDQQDVDVMRERVKNGANLLDSHIFQFDFLNDSFDKLPQGLREIVDDPEKRRKLVIYINPPYVEASNAKTNKGFGENRTGVAQTKIQGEYAECLGRASNELFAQFLIRISKEISGCVIGQFSTLKHIQASNFSVFREAFCGILEKCFIVPADTFDNVKGKFPIGFFVWRLDGDCHNRVERADRVDGNESDYLAQSPQSSQSGEIETSRTSREAKSEADKNLHVSTRSTRSNIFTSTVADVYDRDGEFAGEKTLFLPPKNGLIIDWLRQFYDHKGNHIGYMRFLGTDFQNSNSMFLTLKPSPSDIKKVSGSWMSPRNFLVMGVYFTVRKCIDPTWLNDRDQFLYPNDGWGADVEFKIDCLVFTLFHGQNRVSCRDSINHWIPFSEEEVGARDCFQSHFMSDWLGGKRRVEDNAPRQGELDLGNVANVKVSPVSNANGQLELSPAARAVMDAGRELWRYYHRQPNSNPNASYYDIRLHFQGVKKTANGKEQMNPSSSDPVYTELLANLRKAHRALAQAIEPKVYEYGFLRR